MAGTVVINVGNSSSVLDGVVADPSQNLGPEDSAACVVLPLAPMEITERVAAFMSVHSKTLYITLVWIFPLGIG